MLYAAVPRGQDAGDLMARLRRHAEARDWLVVDEVVDYATTSTPLGERPNWWGRARVLITSGEAKGVVTTSRADAGLAELEGWLHEHLAFLSELIPAAAQGAA